MKFPHTHFQKGKRVWIKLKNNKQFLGKFVERRTRFVVIKVSDCQIQIPTRLIIAMSKAK